MNQGLTCLYRER